MATVGQQNATKKLTSEDLKFLELFHSTKRLLGIQSAEDFIKLLSQIGQKKADDNTEPTTAGSTVRSDRGSRGSTQTSYNYPKISSFGGQGGQGEVNWEYYKFEIEALVADGVFSEKQILHGIRRSVKGEAADTLRRLGTSASIEEVISRLDSTYGDIETEDTILMKLFCSTQQPQETITSFANRLEEYFDKTVRLNVMNRCDTVTLKNVLFRGLRKELKRLATYKHDTIKDYDRFKFELRRLESEVKNDQHENNKTCDDNLTTDTSKQKDQTEESDMEKIQDMAKLLEDRIRELEEVLNNTKYMCDSQDQWTTRDDWNSRRGYDIQYRGSRRGYDIQNRGSRRGYDGNRRGQGHYPHRRPLARKRFSPVCFKCHQPGHYRTQCPSVNRINQRHRCY